MNRRYRKTIIAGNWKMNMTASDTKKFADDIKAIMPRAKWCDVVVCVPFVNIPAALKAFKDNDMSAKVYGNAPGSTIPMSTGFDEWCWGQNIFYAGFGFTNWPNDVCNDLVLQKDGKCRFVCAEDNYRKAVTYFHDWYAEGLMDVEMFSQDTNQLLAKGAQGYLGVSTWWYIEELMGDYAKDYVFLPVLDGPDGTHNVTVRTGGGTNSGNLNVTNKCQSPANLLKFFDQWYDGETVMQLQYGPIGVFFTEQDANGKWKSITEEEAKAKYNKGAGELKSTYEVWGPKLILSEYYDEYFYMEDRAIYRAQGSERSVYVTDTLDRCCAAIAAPIISEGDALGLVLFVENEGENHVGETEYKLAQTIASFLGRHMES